MKLEVPSTAHAAPADVVVIGMGNLDRADDGVGIWAVRELRATLQGRARVEECLQDPTELLPLWRSARVAIVVDAARSGAAPGTVHRVVAGVDPLLLSWRVSSTHALSLPQVVALARALGELPPRLVIYGLEAGSMGAGSALSPPVRDAVPRLVERITAEVLDMGPPATVHGREGESHA